MIPRPCCAQIKCVPLSARHQQVLIKELLAAINPSITNKSEEWTEALRDYGADAIYDCVCGMDSWDLCRANAVLKKDGCYAKIVGDTVRTGPLWRVD